MQTVESAVRERYAARAKSTEAELCCPADYQSEYLKVIPAEVVERDYGCGDPSRYVARRRNRSRSWQRHGEKSVSSPRKSSGRKAGHRVDMTDEMLAVARAQRTGRGGADRLCQCRFSQRRIQDLTLDLERPRFGIETQPDHRRGIISRGGRVSAGAALQNIPSLPAIASTWWFRMRA